MPIALGILGDQLLDARRRHGHDPFLLTLLELDRFAKHIPKHSLEIHYGPRLPLGALRIAALPWLELVLLRRTARADFVFLLGRPSLRGRSGLGAAIFIAFRHIGSHPAVIGLVSRRSSIV